jgi:hypothetical protein
MAGPSPAMTRNRSGAPLAPMGLGPGVASLRWKESPTFMRPGWYLDFMSEILQSADEAALRVSGFGPAIEMVCTEILVQGAIGQHVVAGGEDRGRHGANRLHRAAPRPQPIELGLKVAAFLASFRGHRPAQDMTLGGEAAHVFHPRRVGRKAGVNSQ